MNKIDFISFFLTYNWIFKCYLLILLIFNIFMFYNFFYKMMKTNGFNGFNRSNGKKTDYIFMFKKLLKISKNPIIFEYQLEQINKFMPDKNKYVRYQKHIQYINNLDDKNNSVCKYYKKIKNILEKKNLVNSHADVIIIKLMCINFS